MAPPEVLPSSARALQWSLTGASQRAKGLGPPVDDVSRHTLQQELLSLLSTETDDFIDSVTQERTAGRNRRLTDDSVTQELPPTNPFRRFGWDYLQGRKRIIRRHRLADWSPQQLFGPFRTQLSQWFQSTRFRGDSSVGSSATSLPPEPELWGDGAFELSKIILDPSRSCLECLCGYTCGHPSGLLRHSRRRHNNKQLIWGRGAPHHTRTVPAPLLQQGLHPRQQIVSYHDFALQSSSWTGQKVLLLNAKEVRFDLTRSAS